MFDDRKSLARDLFERNQRAMLRYFTRKVGRDAAPDLLQDAFVRVLGRGRLEAVADPPALLQKIAINLAHDFARKRKTETTYVRPGQDQDDAPSDEAPPEERIEYDRKSRLLDSAVDRLPPRCREVFELSMEDMTVGEIAMRLGISDRMVRKHLAHAMQVCRAALD
ncbi:RNA polymerase sigma factor [Methylosinus sp. Sm6]|uniref:RNA polymerase sigma factor n=1 Tax=Methylosinus sp. Sm6 TaxID=2866948 RepID=UPI001C99ADCA|nr:sigma-70 family RNA polymerase sigma factor [Methylosinus sp. Sm6]MBY6239890.1 sigma-70 family RNA polymerase sigma factor [Methylosinus sp. Sm6]